MFFQCSRYCGGGVRTRPVQCINIETEEKAEEINCDINFKPNPTAECNTQTCLDWVVSEWDRVGIDVEDQILYSF